MEAIRLVTSTCSRRRMWSINQSAKRNSKGVQSGGKASKKRQTNGGKSLRTNQREKRAGKRRSLGMETTQFVTSAFSRCCVNQRRGIQREFKGNSVTRMVYFLVAIRFLVARICHTSPQYYSRSSRELIFSTDKFVFIQYVLFYLDLFLFPLNTNVCKCKAGINSWFYYFEYSLS